LYQLCLEGTLDAMQSGSAQPTYERLLALLTAQGADFEIIDHPPIGTTEVVSALRGHPAAEAAKCIMLMVKLDRKVRKYVLAVVPGDRKVDLDAVRRLYGARYVGFCDPATAERLARAVPGAVLPFAMDPEVELVADPAVVGTPWLYFNAARLDRSVRLAVADYVRMAQPLVHPVAAVETSDARSA
jgi:Ala-tRNA(Pro) deacylase